MYHVYAEDGFESAHRSREAAERVAKRGASRRRIEYRVVAASPYGHGTVVFTATPTAPR